jgi:hypothetical protein
LYTFTDEVPQEFNNTGLDTTQATNSTHTGDNTNEADTADVDDTNATDADTLELLVNNHSITTNTEQDCPVEAQSVVPPVTPPIEPIPPADSPQLDADAPDLDSPIAIELFPHSNPGAPIPGACQDSGYQRSQEAFGAEACQWAPFRSQCDWEVARWAKMRGPTSSAMEELLAIPGVRAR